jgi:hypothetical protein
MRKDYKPILRWALQAGRMMLWLVYGIAIAGLLSYLFGLFPLVSPLLTVISDWLWRLVVVVVVLLATAFMIDAAG